MLWKESQRRAFVLGCALFVGSQGSLAAPTDAEELFERGLERMKAGKVEEGCLLLDRSYALDPLPGAAFTRAECWARAGRAARAWKQFEAFLGEMSSRSAEEQSAQEARIVAARRRMKELEPHVARLTIVVPDGDVRELLLGDRPLAADEWNQDHVIEPGSHRIVLQGKDGSRTAVEVTLHAGESRRIELALPERETDASQPADPSPSKAPPSLAERQPALETTVAPPAPAHHRAEQAPLAESGIAESGADESGSGRWAYGALGLGAAGVVTGTVAGALLIGRKKTVDRHCRGGVCDETGYAATRGIGTLDTVANVGFAVGAAGLGVGLFLLLTDSAPAKEVSSTQLRLDVEGNRAVLRGSW